MRVLALGPGPVWVRVAVPAVVGMDMVCCPAKELVLALGCLDGAR